MSILNIDLKQHFIEQSQDKNTNIKPIKQDVLKIIQLDKSSDDLYKTMVYKFLSNQQSLEALEFVLAYVKLYESKRLQEHPHLTNPQAKAILADLEQFLIDEISCILIKSNKDLIVNHSRIKLIMKYISKNYSFNLSKLCKMIIFKPIKLIKTILRIK